jgi:hypothetical protein
MKYLLAQGMEINFVSRGCAPIHLGMVKKIMKITVGIKTGLLLKLDFKPQEMGC